MVMKLGILFLMIVMVTSQAYATEENQVENTTAENTTKQETVPEKPTETKKNETMYVQERCNIRASYSVESDRVGGLDVGTEVTVVAEYSNGWYKIKYDGGEAYIKAGILRNTKPEIPEENEEEQNETELAEQTQTQTKKPTDGSQDEVDNEYAEMLNEIGVLPEVGHNMADVLLVGVIALAMLGIVYVKYKF